MELLTSTNDLVSSIAITSTNKFGGKFTIISTGNNDLIASIQPKIGNNLPSSLSVPPHNRFSLTVDVQQPPMVKKVLTPVRDATVRESVPHFNYGVEQDMYIGFSSSLSERYRSFVEFDLTQVPTGKNIDSAILKIYHDKYNTSLESMEVLQVSEEWTEKGITWANQPTLNTLVATQSIDQINGYIEFDLTNLVQDWYDGSVYNGGLALKAQDETVQSFIHMYTRESTYPPILEVSYIENYNPSTGHIDLSSSITPRFDVNNDLVGSITIHSTWAKIDTPASLFVNLPWQLSGSIQVSRPIVAGSITARQNVQVQLSGSLTVRESVSDDFPTSILISQPYLQSSIIARQHDTNDISSSIAIRRSENNDLTSFVTPSFPNLSGSILVKQISQLQSSINVEVRVNAESRLNGSIGVFPRLKGSINVKQFDQLFGDIQVVNGTSSFLNSSIAVRKSFTKDLSSSIDAKQWKQLQANLVISSGWLQSSIHIPNQAYKDKSANMVVRVSFINDLTSSINVKSEKVYVFFM